MMLDGTTSCKPSQAATLAPQSLGLSTMTTWSTFPHLSHPTTSPTPWSEMPFPERSSSSSSGQPPLCEAIADSSLSTSTSLRVGEGVQRWDGKAVGFSVRREAWPSSLHRRLGEHDSEGYPSLIDVAAKGVPPLSQRTDSTCHAGMGMAGRSLVAAGGGRGAAGPIAPGRPRAEPRTHSKGGPRRTSLKGVGGSMIE